MSKRASRASQWCMAMVAVGGFMTCGPGVASTQLSTQFSDEAASAARDAGAGVTAPTFGEPNLQGVGLVDRVYGAPDAGVTPTTTPDAGLPAAAPDAGVPATTTPDAGVPTTTPDAGPNQPPDAGVLPPLPVLPSAGLVYSGDRTQSPIDAALAQRLQAIAARGTGRAGVFSKVGDSISTNSSGVAGGYFLNCFDGVLEGTVSWEFNVHLGAHSALAPALDFFKTTRLGTDTSWTRASLATRVGAAADWPLTGTPSPLDQELAAATPRYAVVMYGSNDIASFGGGTYPLVAQAEAYERSLRAITDTLLARGVIPLITTMPPRTDEFLKYTPVFTGVARAIAQGRQVPLIDLNRELMALGSPYGMSGDRVHPTCADYNKCCWFDPASLQNGYNVRNLVTLQAMDRMHRVLDLGGASLDAAAPRQAGDGSKLAPFGIPTLPFGELRDLRTSTARPTEALSCAGAPAVAGPQNLYRLVLTRTTSLRALVLDSGAGAQRVSLLSGPSLSSCLESDPRLVAATLPAGTYYFAVTAPGASGGSEYNFSVTECAAGDAEC